MPEQERQWFTTAQVAQLLEVSQSAVQRWVRLHQIKAVRLPSGQIRIPRSEVDRIIREGLGPD
jgi:excisionase family DNA binding protein